MLSSHSIAGAARLLCLIVAGLAATATGAEAQFEDADLSITKTDGVTSVTPGGSLVYTITASNAGPDATTATVSDTFPASLTGTWTCVGAGGGTCTAAGSGNISDSVNLPVGASVTYTVSASISASATGTLVNTATVSATSASDPNQANNSATDTDVLSGSADLAITKTDGITVATPGGSVTYTITASNAGPSNVSGATVADTFPASLTGTWTCAGAGGGTCTAAGAGNISDSVNLPAGGSATYTVSATIAAAATGMLTNTATVSASVTDPVPGNNSATDTDTLNPSADLAITKTDGVVTVNPGGSVTYTITASNAGPSAITGATVADTFPASLTATWTCVGAGGGTCTAAGSGNISDNVDLPVGASVTYTATATVSPAAAGVLTNTATVASSVTDPNPASNSATDTDTITPAADLSVTMLGPATAVPGGSVAYTVTVTNAGPVDAASVLLDVPTPTGLTFTGATGDCAAPLPCALGTIATGASRTTVVTFAVPAGYVAPDPIAGGASVSSATFDPDAADNTAAASTALTRANLSISKTGPQTLSAVVDYTIVVNNAGPMAAVDVIVADPTPAGLTFVSATSTSGGCVTFPCTLGSIASGSSVTITASYSVMPTAAGPIVNTATVSAASLDVDPTNNTATATTAPTADISIVKTAPAVATPGESTAYTIVVRNEGVSAAADVVVSDPTPGGLTFVSNDGACTTPFPCALGLVAAGETRTITATYAVPAVFTAGASITNTASVTTSTPDAQSANNQSTAVSAVARPTYFLTEGATGSFFDEDLLLANPNATDAPVTLTFYPEGRAPTTATRTIRARSGLRLPVDTLPGLESVSSSVKVSSDDGLPLAVERTQFWDATAYAGHTESAVSGPATRWFFAEGAQGYFDTFVLIANPQAAPVDVTVTFLREGAGSVSTTVPVAPFARRTISAAGIPELANRAFAILVDAPQPVVAERAMYFGSTAARLWSGGSVVAGVTAPASTWYFAEGATGTFFNTFLLLMNPQEFDARVTLRYLLDAGQTVDVEKVVPARGRLTVNIGIESDARLHAASVATLITSDRPIVAERSVYWPTAESTPAWGESHTSHGAPAAAPRWALAEGRTGGPLNFHTYVLLANPGSQPVETTVQFLAAGAPPVVRAYTVPAMSRFTVDVSAAAPELLDQSFITLIETTGDAPIVVERSMYWHGPAGTWSGGSNAVATRLPE
jgi:uncharacterized repeat protein (TIGR01451 family)